MKYHEMTKNYIFREFECGLSVIETANLCFKSVTTVKGWDKGNKIPDECKRLMRMQKRLELSNSDEWHGFKMHGDKLQIPTGQLVTPQELIAGICLLGINSELEIQTSTHLIRLARVLSKIRTG